MLGTSNPAVRLGRSLKGVLRPSEPPGSSGPRTCRVVGHRGAARVAPENTIESFALALDLGADWIETDICVTRDGCFVLWHDADPAGTIALARQAGRECLAFTPDVPPVLSEHRRAVRDLDYETFRRHYGYRRREGGLADLLGNDDPPQVPASTLEDLFAWIARDRRLAGVCLDIKLVADQTLEARALFRRVAEFVSARRALGVPEIRFLTPQEEVLRAFQEEASATTHDHRIRVCGDFELPGIVSQSRTLGLRDVSMGLGRRLWPAFRDEVMEVLRERSYGRVDSVIAWTINEPDRLRTLVAAGVDAILTDDPPLLRMLVAESMRASKLAAGS